MACVWEGVRVLLLLFLFHSRHISSAAMNISYADFIPGCAGKKAYNFACQVLVEYILRYNECVLGVSIRCVMCDLSTVILQTESTYVRS